MGESLMHVPQLVHVQAGMFDLGFEFQAAFYPQFQESWIRRLVQIVVHSKGKTLHLTIVPLKSSDENNRYILRRLVFFETSAYLTAISLPASFVL